MSQNTSPGDLSGLDRAAQLLMMLPQAESAQIIALLPQHKAEKVTLEIIRPDRKSLSIEACEQILRTAREEMQARSYLTSGGVAYARQLLVDAYGLERAEEIMARLIATVEAQPFHYLNELDPSQVATILAPEHPQAIALILSYLSLNTAATILSTLPATMQGEVIRRVSEIQPVSPAIIKRIEDPIKKRIASLLDEDAGNQHTGGLEFVVRAIQQAGGSTERNVLEWLDEKAPDLSAEIRKRLFAFEDIIKIDDRGTQRILRDVDSKDLAVALRGAPIAVRDHLLKNLSSRVGDQIRDELANGAPVRLRLVEEARQRIVGVIRTLEESEEVSLARSGEDVLV